MALSKISLSGAVVDHSHPTVRPELFYLQLLNTAILCQNADILRNF